MMIRTASIVAVALCVTAITSFAIAQDDTAKIQNQQPPSAAGDFFTRIREFVVNPSRDDPYKRVNFQVRWDGKVIPGVWSVSSLSRSTDAIAYRDGGDSVNVRMTPGLTKVRAVTLKRGVTHDAAFEEWADQVWNPAGQSANDLANYRKDVIVDLRNLSGQTVKRYFLFRCWPTKYVALSALEAGNSEAAHESLTIQCESWERDKAVTEPAE